MLRLPLPSQDPDPEVRMTPSLDLGPTTLPSQKYGNPLKNPIYYNGKVPLVKCLKS